MRWPRFWGEGKLAKIEVALSNREEFQVKLLGERLRKKGACRGLGIRAATFVSRLSEFEMKDRNVAVDRRGAGGREGTEGRGGKGAPPPWGRKLACLAKGRSNWRLTWCW
jgi:hypothetical protein